jgi:hypothetical protein
MKNSIFAILVVLCFLSGCTTSPSRYAIIDTPNLSNGTNTEIAKLSDTPQNLHWQIDDKVEQIGTFRVKYHPSYNTKRCVVVEGSIADGKKKYPVVLDTGASQGVFVNDIHVRENNLPVLRPSSGQVYSVQTSEADTKDYGLGLCYVPQLRIGQMTLQDFPCWYLQRHLELKFFGLPIARDDSIIVGLKALREFGFIVFDGINREVEFSHDRVFEPDDNQVWSKYPLSIEEDRGNAFLFVQIPIAGESMKVQLDTGSGNGLSLSEELWEKLSGKLQNVKLEQDTELYPYVGRLSCKRGVITQLQVGDRIIQKAKISIFPDGSPLLSDCDAILGMQYFQDTVMVLDFNNSMLWARNRVGR